MTPVDRSECARALDRLPLDHYGALDPDEADALAAHLAACPACSAAREETRAALGGVTPEAAFPREREVDWGAFARRTVARARGAGRRPAHRAAPRLRLYGGLLAAAAALVVIAGLRLGVRPGPETARGPTAGSPPLAGRPIDETRGEGGADAARTLQRGLARRAAERSLVDGRAVLLDLMQAPARCRREDGRFDVGLEKERARELLRRLNVQRGSLLGPGDQRLADLLGALEELLLDVSTLDDCTAAAQLRALREAIDQRQLLLRIDLLTRGTEGGGTRA